jgi:DNA-binding transcriptional LysR family regulator
VDTKDISLFLAIARLGSISRTAEQLFMSQSTVTTRLQRLERTVGYDLFIRMSNGVQLTTEGQRLMPLAEQMSTIEGRMLSPDTTEVPILRILSGRAFVSVDVPACLKRIVKHTSVHLKVRMGMYDQMKDALLANQVDFCFLGEPIYHPNVKQVEFTPDVIDLVVPAGHHFTHDFPGLRALGSEPLVAFGRSVSPFRKRVMDLLAQAGVYPPVRMELDSIDGIKAMVAQGLGVSFLPRRTLHDAAFKGYVTIPLQNANWTRPTLLAYPDAIHDRPLTQSFVSVVADYYRDLDRHA